MVILTMASGLFPGASVSAAESMGKWVLVKTIINPDDVPLSNASKNTSFETLDEFTITETSVTRHRYNQQYAYTSYPDPINEFSIQFIFDKPPLELIPGNIFTLNIHGQMDLRRREQSGGYLGSDIRYIYGREFILRSIEGEGNVQKDELSDTGKYGASYSQVKLSIDEDNPTGSLTGIFVLDETWAENPDADEINLTLDSSGYRIVWVYRNEGTPAEEAPAIEGSLPLSQEEPDNLFQGDRQGTDSGTNPIIYVVIGVVLISIVSFGLYKLRRDRY